MKRYIFFTLAATCCLRAQTSVRLEDLTWPEAGKALTPDAIVVIPITNDAGRNTGGENALTQISRSTGGRAFFPSAGPTLDRALSEILHDLRTQYLLGYYPKNLPPSPDRFRRVGVTLSRPDLQASTRDGYYGDN